MKVYSDQAVTRDDLVDLRRDLSSTRSQFGGGIRLHTILIGVLFVIDIALTVALYLHK